MAKTPKAIPMYNGAKLNALLDRRKDCKTEKETVSLLNEIAEEIVMNARLISAVRFSEDPVLNPDGTAQIPKGAKMTFALLSDKSGKKYFPAFTDANELMKWKTAQNEQPKTVSLKFEDYAALVIDRRGADGIVINPFGGNLLLDMNILRHWRERKQMLTMGHYETVLRKDDKIEITDAQPFPNKLAKALSEAAKQIPEISAMWMRQMKANGRDAHLAVVEFDGDKKKVFTALGEAGKPCLEGLPLNMLSAADNISKDTVENCEPFYRRQ